MKKVLLLSLLSVLLWATVPVQALTAPALTVVEVGCDPHHNPMLNITVSASYQTDDGGGFDAALVRVYDGDGDWIASIGGLLWTAGSSGASFTVRAGAGGTLLSEAADKNPLRVVFSDSVSGADVDLAEAVIVSACYEVAGEEGVTASGILNFTSVGVHVYPTADGAGTGMSIWATDADGDGYNLVTLTSAQLAALDTSPAENTLLATGDSLYGEVNLYLLTTGEFQVNVGADAEGWVRVMIFSAFPVANVSYDSFNVLG